MGITGGESHPNTWLYCKLKTLWWQFGGTQNTTYLSIHSANEWNTQTRTELLWNSNRNGRMEFYRSHHIAFQWLLFLSLFYVLCLLSWCFIWRICLWESHKIIVQWNYINTNFSKCHLSSLVFTCIHSYSLVFLHLRVFLSVKNMPVKKQVHWMFRSLLSDGANVSLLL